jgi:hypothetical protein
MKHHIGRTRNNKMETTEEIVGYLTEWCRDRIRYSLLEDDDARALVSEWMEWLEPDAMVEVISFSEEK